MSDSAVLNAVRKDEATFSPDPITDGSCALNHDGYDVQIYKEALRDFPKLREVVDKALSKVATGEALVRDTFMSFVKRVPKIDPLVEMTYPYVPNKQILEQMHGTLEFNNARQQGTVADPMMAVIATAGVAQAAIDALPKSVVKNINALKELEEQMEQMFNHAEALEELSQQTQGERAKELFDQAQDLRQKAAEKVEQAEKLAPKATLSEEVEDNVRRAARKAAAAAEEEIEETMEAIEAFGGNNGADAGFGASGDERSDPMTAADRLRLATEVGKSRRLKEIAAMCGRLTRIALNVQRSKIDHAPDEIASLGFGQDLALVLPSELVLLGDEDFEGLFFLRFAEDALAQYELEANEKQGQGPIICALDSSGSMEENGKEVWSKAIALALMAIARRQGRDMMIIHFAAKGDPFKVHIFPKGHATPAQVLETVSTFFRGGTDFEPWMAAAVKATEKAQFAKADVICVSDGFTTIAPGAIKEFNRMRKERQMRCYGILLEQRGGYNGLGAFTEIADDMMTLDNIKNDNPILETIFAV
jgi:uncharacterized protein with von Willebrand factor type A (vWA) domain